LRQLQARLGDLTNRTIAILGLVYTPNTDTLRRSAAVELCRQLQSAGAHVKAFDPLIPKAPPEVAGITMVHNLENALADADAAVLCTEWPQFRDADWRQIMARARRALIIDANRFLEKPLQAVAGVEHISVGRA
jgi:UDPglucose 6-dehydrogenase